MSNPGTKFGRALTMGFNVLEVLSRSERRHRSMLEEKGRQVLDTFGDPSFQRGIALEQLGV